MQRPCYKLVAHQIVRHVVAPISAHSALQSIAVQAMARQVVICMCEQILLLTHQPDIIVVMLEGEHHSILTVL